MSWPAVTVEAAFTYGGLAGGTSLILNSATRGLLNTATLSAEIWTDITGTSTGPWSRKFSTKRGANRAEGPVVRFDPGTCSVELDNSDRRFDPTNLAGPYVVSGATQVTPMRGVRISATWDGTRYWLFTGYADSWQISYQGPAMSLCDLRATDVTKVLSNYDRTAVAPVGAGELSGVRVARILDSVLYAGERAIDVGNSTLQATTLDGDAWTELLKVQDSELGQVYVDGAGRVVFRRRHANLLDTRSNTVQAAFGDGVGELPFETLQVQYDDTTLNNLVRISNVGGTQQIAQDTASQEAYLIHTYDRTDLILQTDSAAADYAGFVLYQTKEPELRFTQLTITPHDDPDALFPHVLGREIGDRISITRRPPGGGTTTRECFIVGIAHDVPGVNEWRTTWQLMDASKYSFLVLNNATLGTLNSNAIAF